MDLVEFLRARLDAEEAKARAALAVRVSVDAGPVDVSTGSPSHVQVEAIERWSAPPVDGAIGEYEAPVRMPHGTIRVSVTADSPSARACAAHIARHDPARVLAEVDAKRRLIDLHPHSVWPTRKGPGHLYCGTCHEEDGVIGGDGHHCLTLRLLALPYADHADYREEWRSQSTNCV